ncbi:DUF6993 domain-containing protein [Microbacterium murale]|uniref:DUF6993 domain-containing protein n=1 Tax=Microbacterium murale TaxID=1081040 RepID=A0ABU0PE89_9MICO|nr:hypothetical protein [Microbacterium murale]MDQ0645646.1 hypothetical protein [Microbacterium murale]
MGLALAACAPDPAVSPSANPEPPSTASPAQEVPRYQPDGSADENLPIFSAVTGQVWASDQRGSGRAYVDALVAAGFDRTAMQVTQDLTTVGNPVESLQFSVRWGEEDCLIGQVGPSTGEPVTAVVDQLAEGRCLVGNTRPIDW